MKNLAGAVKDYLFRRKEFEKIWGGPFNGQEIRRKIFREIVRYCNPKQIIETGTFKGNTTNYMFSESNLQVLTVENDQRSYYYSKIRFFWNGKIKVNYDDCRDFLSRLPQKTNTSANIFFYLDAHWNEDLPLKEELNIIFKNFPRAIIMIDDFKVPFDSGFHYDIYNKVELSLSLISDVVSESTDISIFFPKDSKIETGAKRGSVILTNDKEIENNLNKITEIISYSLPI